MYPYLLTNTHGRLRLVLISPAHVSFHYAVVIIWSDLREQGASLLLRFSMLPIPNNCKHIQLSDVYLPVMSEVYKVRIS